MCRGGTGGRWGGGEGAGEEERKVLPLYQVGLVSAMTLRMSGECRHEQYMSDLQAELSAISEVRHYYSISPLMFSALPLCVDRNYNQP